MGSQLLASKIIVVEEEPRIRSLPALPTAVLGIVGITERGPMGTAKLVTSFDEFIRYFGGDFANSYTVHAVRGFFQNGGQFLYVVRTCHYSNPDVPGSKTSAASTLTLKTPATGPTSGYHTGSVVGPWDLDESLSAWDLKLVIDGVGPTTASFTATAAERENGVDETFALNDGDVLTVKIDGEATEQTITFLAGEFVNIALATAQEVVDVLNAKLMRAHATVTGGGKRVTITSDRKGTTSGVNVTGGTANVALQFTTGNVAGGGNVQNIEAVSLLEVKTIVEAAVAGCTVSNDTGRCRITSNTTGLSSSVQVHATSISDGAFGFDNAVHSGSTGAALDTLRLDGKYDGSYGDRLKHRITDATSGTASEFNLIVEDGGVAVETWPNLTMDDTLDNFIEKVLNNEDTGSRLVTATDLDAVAPLSGRPANGLYGPMTGGDDGLTGLNDNDFIGSAVGKTGIRALDTAPEVTLLNIPDRPTPAVHQAMYQYSELVRDRAIYCLWDPPSGSSATGIITYFEVTAALLNATEMGDMSWPWVKILNPNRAVYGDTDTLTVPPTGHVAGMIARSDAARPGGIYIPPAGIEVGQLYGVVGVETEEAFDESKRDLVYPKRINTINSFPGSGGYFKDGCRTAKGNGNFPTVAERRGVSYIEQTIKKGLQWARFKNNDAKLRASVYRTIYGFLLQQMRLGAFRSMKPKEAFFVDVGEGLNPPSEQFAGKLNVRVGLATQKPAEFIILSFSQDTRALEEELLASQR